MLGTKELLDKKGNIVCNRGEDWWWDALAHADDPIIEIDWKWEARDNFTEKLAYRFIKDADLWEEFEAFVKDELINAPSQCRDDELLNYLNKNGIIITSADYDLFDWLYAFICDDEWVAEEYVEWLK